MQQRQLETSWRTRRSAVGCLAVSGSYQVVLGEFAVEFACKMLRMSYYPNLFSMFTDFFGVGEVLPQPICMGKSRLKRGNLVNPMS